MGQENLLLIGQCLDVNEEITTNYELDERVYYVWGLICYFDVFDQNFPPPDDLHLSFLLLAVLFRCLLLGWGWHNNHNHYSPDTYCTC